MSEDELMSFLAPEDYWGNFSLKEEEAIRKQLRTRPPVCYFIQRDLANWCFFQDPRGKVLFNDAFDAMLLAHEESLDEIGITGEGYLKTRVMTLTEPSIIQPLPYSSPLRLYTVLPKYASVTAAFRGLAEEQACIKIVSRMRWPNGWPVCPYCGVVEGGRTHHWLATQKRWKCYSCHKQFSVKVGTIFEDSALNLQTWLRAVWLLRNSKKRVSSYGLARATGISQKSAWFLLKRLRSVENWPSSQRAAVIQ